jgi:ERCC4-type nuclease
MTPKAIETSQIMVQTGESIPSFPATQVDGCDHENYQTVQIVVDDRERPSGMVAELEKAGKAVVRVEHLLVGDYCVDGAVLIERKTARQISPNP